MAEQQQNNRAVRNQVAANRSARDLAKAESERSRADAQRLQAEALAERARAETARLKAAGDVEQARVKAQIKADEDKRAREAAKDAAKAAREAREAAEAQQTRERAYQVGMQIAAVGGGVALGHRLAHSIEKRHVAHLKAITPQTAAVGYQAQQLLKGGKGGVVNAAARTKLAGLVTAADRAGLTKIRGPVGAVMGGILITEAMIARMLIAPNVDNATVKEAINQVSTGSLFAATSLIGQRLLQNRTLAALPPVKGIAAIESARAVAGMSAHAPVRAAQAGAAGVRNAARTAQAVRSGVLGAVGQTNLATARRLAVRGGVLGGVAALGFAAAQTETGRAAVAWVKGHFRTELGRPYELRGAASAQDRVIAMQTTTPGCGH